MTDLYQKTRAFLSKIYHELDVSYLKGTFRLTRTVITCARSSEGGVENDFRLAAIHIAQRIDRGDDLSARHAYHNPLHFAKVVRSFSTLADLHNKTCRFKDRLSDLDIAMGLLAATAHDLGHDGTGNTVGGAHTPFRLEQIAIDQSREWILAKYPQMSSGLLDEALSLIYATDVSGQGTSPADYIRCAYDYVFKGRLPSLAAPTQLKQLHHILKSPKMILVAALLQDADILSSVLDEHHHATQNLRVAKERHGATDEHSIAESGLFFIEKLLKLRLTTDVANDLIGDNLRSLQRKHRRTICLHPALG